MDYFTLKFNSAPFQISTFSFGKGRPWWEKQIMKRNSFHNIRKTTEFLDSVVGTCFHVLVFGTQIIWSGQSHVSIKASNLSHGTWARFRLLWRDYKAFTLVTWFHALALTNEHNTIVLTQKKTLTLIQDPGPELWNKTSVDPQNSTVVNSWNLHKTPLKKQSIKLYKTKKKRKYLLPFSSIWNLMEGKWQQPNELCHDYLFLAQSNNLSIVEYNSTIFNHAII